MNYSYLDNPRLQLFNMYLTQPIMFAEGALRQTMKNVTFADTYSAGPTKIKQLMERTNNV